MKIKKMNNEEKIVKLYADPFFFIHKVLGVKYITQEQEQIVSSVWKNKYTGVKAAHNVGKTFIEACIVLAFIHAWKDSIVITTAPTARQVKDLLWAEINRLYAKAKGTLVGEMKLTSYTIKPKWFATGITTEAGKEEESAVKFQGYHAKRILVVIDEAVGVQPAIWEAVDGITSSKNAKVLAVGNPSMPNCAFKKHLDKRNWNVLHINALNHPNIKEKKEKVPGAVSYDWVKDKICKWCSEAGEKEKNTFEFEGKIYKPNSLFLWKVLGEFPEESTDALIPLYQIQQAMSRYPESVSKNPFTYLSIDVARFGSDYSVFAINQSDSIRTFPFFHVDIAKLTGEAIHKIKQFKPTKVGVDCDGIGAGVFDNLKEAKDEGIIDTELIEIHGGANPLQLGQTEDYVNLRAQMYWLFKQDIDTVSLEPSEDIEEGFNTIKYYFNTKGKIQIELKEEIKKRLGRSPDIEDAIVYANFLKYTDPVCYASQEEGTGIEEYETVTKRMGI